MLNDMSNTFQANIPEDEKVLTERGWVPLNTLNGGEPICGDSNGIITDYGYLAAETVEDILDADAIE